jgi:hypothetical protein
VVFSAVVSSKADVTTGLGTPGGVATSSPTATQTPTSAWADEFGTSVTKTVTATPTKNIFDLSTAGAVTQTPTAQTVSGTPTETSTTTPKPTNTPAIARSGLALFPTAYSNGLYRSDGFNLDILFSYFIGSIVEKQRGLPTETLNPLRLWLFTVDAKYGWLRENGDAPGIASGLMDTLLLQGGSPGATGTSTGSLKFTAQALGSIYTVASKRLSKDTAAHIGIMRGNLAGIGGGSKFVKRILPTGNFSNLMLQFASGLADERGESAPNIVYTGFNFKWLGTPWRFEFIKPFPLTKHPFLIDSKIDRLFAFNLSYEHWDGGYALLGYFNFRFTILPTTPKGPMPLR